METLSPAEAANLRLTRRDSVSTMDPAEAANLRLKRRDAPTMLDPTEAANLTLRRRDSVFGQPSSEQLEQWERSYYLNTGQPAPGTKLTLEQLQAKYGSPHINGNSPPNAPTP